MFADKIFKAQKKSLRIINKKTYTYHTEPLLKENKLLKVPDQYKLSVQIFMHQLKFHRLPNSFDYMYSIYFPSDTNYMTRQTNLAKCNRFRTHYTSKLPLHNFPRIWNQTDQQICSIQSQISTDILMFKDDHCHYFIFLYWFIVPDQISSVHGCSFLLSSLQEMSRSVCRGGLGYSDSHVIVTSPNFTPFKENSASRDH